MHWSGVLCRAHQDAVTALTYGTEPPRTPLSEPCVRSLSPAKLSFPFSFLCSAG